MSPGNHRPVSLTCIICKIVETLIRERIIRRLKDNGLFSNRQYGFLTGHSTVLQLMTMMDKWNEVMDGSAVVMLYTVILKKKLLVRFCIGGCWKNFRGVVLQATFWSGVQNFSVKGNNRWWSMVKNQTGMMWSVESPKALCWSHCFLLYI